jgi:predicted tellurium resistance membrane protein TerC
MKTVVVASTFLIAKLPSLQFVKLAGGAVILWLAVQLLSDDSTSEENKQAGSLWKAFWIFVVADLSMGTDNMLAVAGASHGDILLLLFGLGLSIPIVVFIGSLMGEGRKRQVDVNGRIKSLLSFSALFAKYSKAESSDCCALKSFVAKHAIGLRFVFNKCCAERFRPRSGR